MDTDAFFSSGDHWAEPWVLNVELIESLRFGPLADQTDLDLAIALTRLLHHDFVSYGTDGKGRRLNDANVQLVIMKFPPRTGQRVFTLPGRGSA
ncbi:hypothetical protein ACFTY8_46680 [Streptomyces mirabilis]|uniref:hypothetical protein n=1 Tax=Streptomyces mirabilis TaxID=68239 RepID=UPI003634C67B